jgi:putative ABC transport system substrate-binding protein
MVTSRGRTWRSSTALLPATDPELANLAAELVRLNVDAIHAAGPAAVRAARSATSTIPIVAHDFETDPVASGLIASLGRPGGNVTGMFLDLPELAGKWLELLRESVPRLSRVAILWDPGTDLAQRKAAEHAAGALRLKARVIEARGSSDLDRVFGSMRREGDQAVLVLSSPDFGNAETNARIARLAVKNRLPSITLFPGFAERGGFMAYGPFGNEMYQLEGRQLGRILKGARPAELPVERPARFELVVNAKTMRALGLTLPPSMRVRVDRVIE